MIIKKYIHINREPKTKKREELFSMGSNNNGIENCWEFWDCQVGMRNECPAYTLNAGKDCFNLATDFCPKRKVEYEFCLDCPWYKKIKQDSKQKNT